MNIRLQMVIETEDGQSTDPIDIFSLQRQTLLPETLGLSLSEAQAVLASVQQHLTTHQVQTFVDEAQVCPHCQVARPRKGQYPLKVHTLFGELTLTSPRFYTCACEATTQQSVSPLAQRLPERTTPEYLYLQTKWAALMSYGTTVRLLEEVLPIHVSLTSLKRHVMKVAERLEQSLGPEQASFIEGCSQNAKTLPEPTDPIIIGLDGGYLQIRDEQQRKAGVAEVIVGKSIRGETDTRCFGFVQDYDQKPRRRLFEVLKAQGFQSHQSLMFLSDGGTTVRDLQFYFSPTSEHLLDWFHITMRLTVMQQMVKGLPTSLVQDLNREQLAHELERLKWLLWQGDVFRALRAMDDLADDLESFPSTAKLLKAIREFHTYIRLNRDFIPNYADRHRYGERISTAFVESTVNYLISKRFVKKQQMRWTKRGAHLLLQIRINVFNQTWRSTFVQWYPALLPTHQDFPIQRIIA